MKPAVLIAACAAAGAVSTLAHVHTEAWWLGLMAAAVMAGVAWRLPPGQAAMAGWSFGVGWMVAATWWLHISMHRYGGMPSALAGLAVLALAAALSVYWAAAMAVVSRLRTGRAWPDLPVFACAWLLAELARGQWFTGFPWAASGYAQVDGPLAGWAPWLGVYGIGAMVALCGASLAWAVAAARRRWPVGLALPLLALCLPALLPADFSESTGSLRISLIQTAVAQDEKFDASRMARNLRDLEDALQAAQGELVVAPETAIPLLPQDIPPPLWEALSAPFTHAAGARAALIGVPLVRDAIGYTNSVVAFSAAAGRPEAPSYRYDKHHLVPFGEFIPAGFRWFVDLMNMPLGDFERGSVVQPSFAFGTQRLAPNICYEDLFGEELARRFHDAAGAPTMLVNLSNIAWFGPTMAIDQHLHISRLRSLELQRPMLRATNTGATAVIDHRGRVRAWLKPQERGLLEASAEGRQGLTPYARWVGAWGLLPLWAAAGLVLMLAALRRSRAGET